MPSKPVYDRIGVGYARQRRPDPRWAEAVREAVDGARSVVNVGAGTGSYEPDVAVLIAVEPSAEMVRQRPAGAAPVVRATAERLPFADDSFDVALAILTLHHWSDWRAGLAEMCRVSARQVVVTFDMDDVEKTWLAPYVPEVMAFDRRRTPPVSEVASQLEGGAVAPLPVPADMMDGVMLANWARPEAYLDSSVRAAASGFAQARAGVVDRFVAQLDSDLRDGSWDRRHGHLRSAASYDGGYRIVVGGLGDRPSTPGVDRP